MLDVNYKFNYTWIQEALEDTVEHLTYWLLRLRRFPSSPMISAPLNL